MTSAQRVTGRRQVAFTSRKMAETFGLEVLLEEDISKELEQARFTGKLRNVLTARGVPAITPELGGNDFFEEEHIAFGVRGVTNLSTPPLKRRGVLIGSFSVAFAFEINASQFKG